jgi:IclR family transcriptional regulator, acetate operon repressor
MKPQDAQSGAPTEESEAGFSGMLDRGLAIIELLVRSPEGLPLQTISERLRIPRSATHRLLTSLSEQGYVRQDRDRGFYVLTSKLLTLAFSNLAANGVVDAAQPVLDRLAEQTGELVRLSVIDGERLTWVAKAQGARSGLRYDPDMGMEAQLSCSSSGVAWLSCLSDDEALAIVRRQGFGKRQDFGPEAPETPKAFLANLHAARRLGYAFGIRTYSEWMSAIAAPLRHPGNGQVIGAISIAGPSMRLGEERLHELAPDLLAGVAELAAMIPASPMLMSRVGRTPPTGR